MNWPEGPRADRDAARERYERDMAATRRRLRDLVRADLPAAHLGLGIVVIAVAIGTAPGPPAPARVRRGGRSWSGR